MKKLITVTILIILSGCGQQQSSIRWQPIDPNCPIGDNIPWPTKLTGSAADKIAEVLAANTRDEQGRMSEMMKFNPYIYAGLIGFGVLGVIFWAVTRSKWGWIIPASCATGIVFITLWIQWSQWIIIGVLTIGIGLLVYKSIEYQKERNEETLKRK